MRFGPARGPPAAGRKQQTPSRHLHRAEDSQPRFRHAPVAAANQCSVATPQLLSPSGIGSRFPTQAVRLFSFHRNLGSIVAESPWLRADNALSQCCLGPTIDSPDTVAPPPPPP